MKSIIRIIASTIIFAGLAQGAFELMRILALEIFVDARFYTVWSQIATPLAAGQWILELFYWSAGIFLTTGLLFTLVYRWACKKCTLKPIGKGALYGLAIFLVGALPQLALGMLYFHISNELLLIYTAVLAAVFIINGAIVGILNSK